jgi:spermidine/putrescine transport system substrate-binding protein
MRKTLSILGSLMITGLAVLAGCGSDEAQTSGGSDKPTLNVYMWSEYIDPEIPAQFEAATGIPVRVDVYEDTETMMGKLQHQGGDRQYDVVVVSDHAIETLASLGIIRELDFSKIPNIANVQPQFRKAPFDPEGKHFAAYQWGTQGLMYRKDQVPNFEPSWSLIFEEGKQPGPFVLIDSMRDMFAAALKYKGYSANTTNPQELKEAADLIIAAKKSPKCLGFEGGVGGKNKVVDGTAAVAVVYGGDALRAMSESEGMNYAIPEEGSIVYLDGMTIPKNAPNQEAAHQFINYILDPKVGAQLSKWTMYGTPNAESMKLMAEDTQEMLDTYPDEETAKKLEYLQDMGDATKLYDELWRTVKTR